MRTVELRLIAEYIDGLLEVSKEPDREGNGLVLQAGATVSKLGAAVNTSFESIQSAAEKRVDLLLVHHTSWKEIDLHLTGEKFARLRRAGISLYAAHEALDKAAGFGTGDTLAELLGLEIEGRLSRGEGVYGRFPFDSFQMLVEEVGKVLNVPVESRHNHTQFGRGAIVTGAAGSTARLQEARELGCDTYLTGEGSLYTRLFAREIGINLIFGTHYATEFPGIKAFAENIAGRFELPWEPIPEAADIR